MASYTRPEWIFKTNPENLSSILIAINEGTLALPYFQRDWVWSPENIKELLISIIQAFPVGSLLMLQHTKGTFKTKYFAGTQIPDQKEPERLVLDGQQRLTSLYQTLYSKHGVKKENEKVPSFFYLSLKRLMEEYPVEEAIIYTDDSKIYKEDRQVIYDLQNREAEFENLCLPFNIIMLDDYRRWLRDLRRYYTRQKSYNEEKWDKLEESLEQIHENYIEVIKSYQFPIIELHKNTPLPAVCHIFEKVNTTGVVLNVFELLTAILWAQGTDLPKMWESTKKELDKLPNLEGVDIDRITFLQTVSLLATLSKKRAHPDKRIGVSCKRDALLELDTDAINEFWQPALTGYKKSAKILYENGIYSDRLLPYKTMLAPLAAICAKVTIDIGDIKHYTTYNKIKVWFWRSVFSSRYSSGGESKAGKDVEQLAEWIDKDVQPDIIRQFSFNANILYEVTTIRNAVYSGVLCLILKHKPRDFRSGFEISTQLFHDEKLDHHHIFPKKYLDKAGIGSREINCSLNKTLIDASTNRFIRDKSPAIYTEKFQEELNAEKVTEILNSHKINKDLMLRAPKKVTTPEDKETLKCLYQEFLKNREEVIVALIEEATKL